MRLNALASAILFLAAAAIAAASASPSSRPPYPDKTRRAGSGS